MNRLIVMLLVLLALVAGCAGDPPTDPSEKDLMEGRNLDIGRMHGEIVNIQPRCYAGDRTETAELIGKTYYVVSIDVSAVNAAYPDVRSFLGVAFDTVDLLEVGMVLPSKPIHTPQMIAKMEGKVIDRVAYLSKNEFWVVVDCLESIELIRVSKFTFYKLIDIGMRLPRDWDTERSADYVEN